MGILSRPPHGGLRWWPLPARIQIGSYYCRARMAERFGAWQLDALLAVGGLAEVWRAERGGGHLAAIKRLHTHLLRNEVARDQFAIEQQVTTRLPEHQNVIHANEAGDIDGRPYTALELLPGSDLRRAMADGTIVVTAERALTIVAAACDGADHLHAQGWIHGDIHPGNLIVDHQTEIDRVVLIDLGVARRAGQAGTVRGTHAYMAPEQIRGEAWTPATDVFALGVVLWELASGARLFHRGPPWLSMAAVIDFEPPPLPDPALNAIARAALEKQPSARTPSAAEFAAALRSLKR